MTKSSLSNWMQNGAPYQSQQKQGKKQLVSNEVVQDLAVDFIQQKNKRCNHVQVEDGRQNIYKQTGVMSSQRTVNNYTLDANFTSERTQKKKSTQLDKEYYEYVGNFREGNYKTSDKRKIFFDKKAVYENSIPYKDLS
jgi:hypothetical protein